MSTLPILLVALAVGEAKTWKMVAPPFDLPPTQVIILTTAGGTPPGHVDHEPRGKITKFDETIKLPNDGPFDLYWQPKEGKAVCILTKVKADELPKGEVKFAECVGVVRLRGDALPRASKVVLAPLGDPGPTESGHSTIQQVLGYRQDLIVPEGEYSLWIVTENGARGQRIESKVRVLAGRITNID